MTGYERELAKADKNFKSSLKMAGFFTFQGSEWAGGLSLEAVKAINWQPEGLERFRVKFYFGDSSQTMETVLNLENFSKLAGYLKNGALVSPVVGR
jgi:hypothetical protein